MERVDRKAATAAWKERKAPAGIYALRCSASGECWVGRAGDLDAVEKRLLFSLRLATSPHRSLQDAARAHGAESFRFERLELFDDEGASPELRDAILKRRADHWRETLGAQSI